MFEITQWLTFGMSAYQTPGFQDTSRFMHEAFSGVRVYAEPSSSFATWRRLQSRPLQWTRVQEGDEVILRPPFPIPQRADMFDAFIRLQSRRLDRMLQTLWGREWRASTLVYLTNWSFPQRRMIEYLRPRCLVFDVVDDVLAFPYAYDRTRVLRAIEWLVEHATVVTAVSRSLVDQIRNTWQTEAVWLPNGVNARHFTSAEAMESTFARDGHSVTAPFSVVADLMEERAAHPDKIFIGFAGTLNHWIDYASMLRIVEQDPHIRLALFGRIGAFGSPSTEQQFQALLAHPAVRHFGAVPYDVLPACLHRVDLLILPRVPGAASDASNPLKLYEYLAVGKPVIAHGVPIPEDLQDLVYRVDPGDISSDSDHWLRGAVDELCSHRPSLAAARQQYAARHSWHGRVSQTVNQASSRL